MGTRRPPGSPRGAPPANTFRGSMFDQSKPPALPRGLLPAVRREATAILDQSAFLEECHVDQVVRLAQHRLAHRQLMDRVLIEGVLDPEGEPHPLLAEAQKASKAAESLERALSISVRARAETTSKSERRRQQAADDAHVLNPPGRRPLRLA